MKLRLLLCLLLFSCGILSAQDDTIRTLIITEARMDRADYSYVELTNMGTDTLNLSQFEFGRVDPFTSAVEGDPFQPGDEAWMMLPDRKLAPGESFIIVSVLEWTEEQYALDVARFGYSPDHQENITKKEMWELADIQMHRPESPTNDPTDSISDHYQVMETWSGRDCWYIRHHVTETDSVIVDQVGGVFTDANGSNPDGGMIDVAGVTGATGNSILVRRFNVKHGNINFRDAKGVDYEDSEWIPIPRLGTGGWEQDRAVFWTLGNHGNYSFDENSLTPLRDDIDVNWSFKLITLPWGVRNDDSLMFQFEKRGGLAWDYIYAPKFADSAFVSCRTGDKLTVYACGDDLETVTFSIIVVPPTADANIVVPKRSLDEDGNYENGGVPYEVSDKIPGMDTISNVGFATRVDSLLKYLELPGGAKWNVIWKDGVTRTDLIDGDILTITARNGTSTKDYYIKVDDYRKAHNPYLSSITWPDIPEWLKGAWGWNGDTIPNFVSGKYNYRVEVPFGSAGIPALVAKTVDVNASVKVDRATTLSGAPKDRTITYTTAAEDDTTQLVYKVELFKQKDPTDFQPWDALPIISEWVFQEEWDNYYLEIFNPGNQPLDLSDYMIIGDWSDDPLDVIGWHASADSADWNNRYRKYIPGYKWVDSQKWKSAPATLEKDTYVNSNVQPGDVFVLGLIYGDGEHQIAWANGTLPQGKYPATEQCDVIFKHVDPDLYGNEFGNPWNEYVGPTCLDHWYGSNIYLYKMDEAYKDSMKLGLKAVDDPAAFIHIETFGEMDGTGWKVFDTINQIETASSCVRKPEFFEPKKGARESFGNTPEESEWLFFNRAYFDANNVPWPLDVILCSQDLGTHFMNEVTVYQSRITSVVYKPSGGFSLDELIRGVITGTSVDVFLSNINKADTAQTLKLISGSGGDTLSGSDILADGDTLLVISANQDNMTKYVLEVNLEGLNNIATLTSTVYVVADDGATGTVSGMEYGDLLADVVADISTSYPAATMTVIDAEGDYMPFKKLNFDTNYVNVTVNDQIFIEVVAENGTTTILYQLTPTSTASDAFVTSEVFTVDQDNALIKLIPSGTTVQSLLKNVVPAAGASMQIVDKLGHPRALGDISRDDKLIVTSQDGEVTKVYYFSMLAEEEDEVGIYLAYVLSDVYGINQVTLQISGGGLNDATEVSAFLANLIPAPGATAMVVDENDVENTGTLTAGDLVKVIAADGVTTAYYIINVYGVAIDELNNGSILVYPNPSAGMITVTGLEPGNRIRVYNMLGVAVRDIVTYQELEVISLDNQPNGIYFILVSDDDVTVGRYKLIVE